jgi:hypothetical protein
VGEPNLITHILGRAQADPAYRAVVLAHPSSGTTWLCDTLDTLGHHAAHELLRPADAAWVALVTFRQLGWREPATDRLGLVRDPVATLESAAALYAKRPRVARDAYAQICGSGHSTANPAIGAAGPLFVAALTLDTMLHRLRASGLPIFRIEEASSPAPICEDRAPRRNPHRIQGRAAQGLDFASLVRDFPHLAASLARHSAALGYPVRP